jgi:hypothetical protein
MKKLFALLVIVGMLFVGGARLSVFADVGPEDFEGWGELFPRE